jgi:hypothetical protein
VLGWRRPTDLTRARYCRFSPDNSKANFIRFTKNGVIIPSCGYSSRGPARNSGSQWWSVNDHVTDGRLSVTQKIPEPTGLALRVVSPVPVPSQSKFHPAHVPNLGNGYSEIIADFSPKPMTICFFVSTRRFFGFEINLVNPTRVSPYGNLLPSRAAFSNSIGAKHNSPRPCLNSCDRGVVGSRSLA